MHSLPNLADLEWSQHCGIVTRNVNQPIPKSHGLIRKSFTKSMEMVCSRIRINVVAQIEKVMRDVHDGCPTAAQSNCNSTLALVNLTAGFEALWEMTWYQFDFALNFPAPFNFHGDMCDMPLYRDICELPLSEKNGFNPQSATS
jgi:hypothetical protein